MRCHPCLPACGALRHVRGRRFSQFGVLWMLANIAAIISGPAESERCSAAVGAIGGGSDGGQVVSAVGQRKAERKCPIRPEPDHAVADLNFSVRFSGAVDNELGIDVEPKAFSALPAAHWTGKARHSAAPRAGNGKLRYGGGRNQKLAPNEFGNFE